MIDGLREYATKHHTAATSAPAADAGSHVGTRTRRVLSRPPAEIRPAQADRSRRNLHAALAQRVRQLLAGGDTEVLLAGPGPDGLAVLRLRASIWTAGNECYLAELYVVPQRRNSGLGRALMLAAMDLARTGSRIREAIQAAIASAKSCSLPPK